MNIHPVQFHETKNGRKFYEVDLPEMIHQLKRIADSLEKLDEKKEIKNNTYEHLESLKRGRSKH